MRAQLIAAPPPPREMVVTMSETEARALTQELAAAFIVNDIGIGSLAILYRTLRAEFGA